MDAVTLGLATADAKKKYVAKQGLKAALPTPWFSAHRGNLNVYPENSLEACRAVTMLGSHALNVDFWLLADGGSGIIHDQTLDRTTTASGNITDLDSAAVQQLVVDTPTWFAPNSSWGNLKVPLGDQVLREFGNRIFLELEAKTYAGSGAALVKLLQRYGIGPDAARIASFSAAELSTAAAAGYETCYLFNGTAHSTATPASLTALGAKWVGIDITATDLQTPAAIAAEVARWHAGGIKIHASIIQRRYDLWPWIAAGADSYAADDDLYVRPDWVPRTTDPFKTGNYSHGMIAAAGTSNSAFRGVFVGNVGHTRYQLPLGAGFVFNLQGWGCPVAGAIETTLQAAAIAGATSVVLGPQNAPLNGETLTIDPAGTVETVTVTATPTRRTDGLFTVPITALANSHASGARVYGGTFTITGRTTFDAPGSDTTRFAGMVFGSPDDRAYTDSSATNNNGYVCHIRGNGNIQIAARAAGVLTTAPAGDVGTEFTVVPLVLSGALTAGAAITALPVGAIPAAIAANRQFMLPTGQVATTSAASITGATSIPIASLTPTDVISSGTSIPQTVPWKFQRTATQVIFTRTDTNTPTTWTDTSWFGGYLHLGMNENAKGFQISHSEIAITTP